MIYTDFLDPEQLKLYVKSLNQRAKNKRVQGQITVEALRTRILESGGACEYCRANIVNAEFEIDHIIPLGRGGEHSERNLATCCPDCNRHKSGKHPAKFVLEVIARTGEQTPLCQRVLAHYNMTAQVQLSLFEADDGSKTDYSAEKAAGNDGADTNRPPYRWS